MTARITAASVPIHFVDGQTFQFSPLTDKDFDELDEWVQSKFIEIARKSLSSESSQQEREETLTLAMRDAATLTFMSPRGIAMISNVPGMTFLCWISLRKMHPDVTQDVLRTIVDDPRNIALINEKFQHVNTTPGGNGKPKKAHRASK